MPAFDTIEIIGYIASALIVLSLLMASVLKLRIINLIGAAVFTAYGVLIASWPVILTNAAIVLIDVYYLVVMLRDRARSGYFEVVAVPHDSPVLERFVAHHLEDVHRFQPSFDGLSDQHRTWMVLRDGTTVGAVAGQATARDRVTIDLDYVTREHRDFTAGEVLFGHRGAFTDTAVLETRGETAAHRRYLARMGFERDGDRWLRTVEGRGPASPASASSP